MSTVCGILAAFVLSILGLIHIYWGFGGKWWIENIVPEKNGVPLFPLILPAFFVVAALLYLGVYLIASQLGFLPVLLSPVAHRYLVWLLAGVFLVRAIGDGQYAGFTKSIKNTPFGQWDTRVYSPLCLALGVLVALVAMTR